LRAGPGQAPNAARKRLERVGPVHVQEAADGSRLEPGRSKRERDVEVEQRRDERPPTGDDDLFHDIGAATHLDALRHAPDRLRPGGSLGGVGPRIDLLPE
jgi:hypothetical protein